MTSALSPADSASRTPWLLPAVAVLVFLSGACALVYQVLWLRLLSLTFGVTVYAASTVLASFMGGLALGSLVAGHLADRSRHPLRLFGFVELGIGTCALATPAALAAAQALHTALFSGLPDSLAVATAIRFVLSFAVLIVPTALMGATMPAAIRAAVTRFDRLGTGAGLLYASNTAGAILGALVAGFHLVPDIGMRQSFLLAAAVNGAVGLLAVVGSLRVPPRATATTAPAAMPVAHGPGGPATRGAWLVLVVFAVSGFASLALEVVWFRVLGLLLGPTNYAFTVMLAAVLAGIALGSALITPLLRWRLDWWQGLAVAQIGAALVAVQSFSGLVRRPVPPEWLQSWAVSPTLEYVLPSAVASVLAILPTALFLGLAFPIGLRLWAGDAGSEYHTARRVGFFYAVNLCGAILGAVVAGFLLLPYLGSHGSLIVLASLFLLSGLALQATLFRTRPAWTVVAAAAVVVFAAEAWAVPDPLDIARLRVHRGGPVLWQQEGVQSTVSVVGGPGEGNRVLYLNGWHQANDTPAMVFVHRRIGLLPAVLHLNPRRALVVGLGGGVTAGALGRFPGMQVDVVELSEGVVRAADYFSHVNFEVLRRPNVRLRVDDGRNFLLKVREPYDVITADAIVPHQAGANNLNSVEYFELVRNALATDGVVLHWNGGVTDTQYKLILRAFVQVFPHATLWGDGALMVGTKQPMSVSLQAIEARLADPITREVLGWMNVETVNHLVRMFRARPREIQAYLGRGPALSDNKPSVEYFLSLPGGDRDLTRLANIKDGIFHP